MMIALNNMTNPQHNVRPEADPRKTPAQTAHDQEKADKAAQVKSDKAAEAAEAKADKAADKADQARNPNE